MQADDVALGEQVPKTPGRLGVAVAELVGVIVKDHPHPERFGEIGKLGADVAVADDAERLAPDFVAVGRRLVPAASVGCDGARRDPAQKHDDLADHQFGDAAGVGEGRIEDRHANPTRRVDVDLIGPDVEAPDREQPIGRAENICVELRARADADHVHALDGFAERVALERLGKTLDVGIAGGLHQFDGAVVDALEQQDLDPVLRQRELRGLRTRVCQEGFQFRRKPALGTRPASAVKGTPPLWRALTRTCGSSQNLTIDAPRLGV